MTMNKKVILEALDVNNWLKVCDLSVSSECKRASLLLLLTRQAKSTA